MLFVINGMVLKKIKFFLKPYYYKLILFMYKIKAAFFKVNVVFFNDNIFLGKRIIIVGPADTSLSYISGKDIDSFDFVIRINKSPLSLQGKEEFLGTRTDVLYHCLSEAQTAGGELNFEVLKSQKNRYIIYPYYENELEYNLYKILSKYKVDLYRSNPVYSKKLLHNYTGKWPTTGLRALSHLLSCDFSELHITGFTFFRTAYALGYRDEYQNAEESKKLAESTGTHCVEDEAKIFKEIYKENINKNIKMDDFLKNLVAE